jgi:hypothetical protein
MKAGTVPNDAVVSCTGCAFCRKRAGGGRFRRQRALVDISENRTLGALLTSQIFGTPSFNSGAYASAGDWALSLRRDLS